MVLQCELCPGGSGYQTPKMEKGSCGAFMTITSEEEKSEVKYPHRKLLATERDVA